jgi:hypothetical protein
VKEKQQHAKEVARLSPLFKDAHQLSYCQGIVRISLFFSLMVRICGAALSTSEMCTINKHHHKRCLLFVVFGVIRTGAVCLDNRIHYSLPFPLLSFSNVDRPLFPLAMFAPSFYFASTYLKKRFSSTVSFVCLLPHSLSPSIPFNPPLFPNTHIHLRLPIYYHYHCYYYWGAPPPPLSTRRHQHVGFYANQLDPEQGRE